MKQLVDFSSRFRILKGGKISLVVSALLGSVTISFAAPSGGVVTSGSASINQSGKVTNINQSTQKASINWQKFNVAVDETVNFNQPNVNSITLNRVVGNERSVIDGALNANGQVWLLNSNGVLFGKNASINTSGLLATTAKLSDEDFNAGNYSFKDATSNSIINQGIIEVANSGSVVLASNEVVNEGTIKAIKGSIHLVGASEYSLNLSGNSLVEFTVDKGVLDALVENSGTIIADGGEIYLTTNAVDELLDGMVNNEGIIQANSMDDLLGYVELFAHGGEAQIGGSITALDGFVETSGKEFTFNDAKIEAGEWLIDPVNVTIDSGLASAIETQLGVGDATITTTSGGSTPDTSSGESGTEGNIYVNSDITWNTANKLTLKAYNDIYIHAIIDGSAGNGQVALWYGQGAVNAGNTAKYDFGLENSGFSGKINLSAGDNFFTKRGSNGVEETWKVITDLGTEASIGDGTTLQGIVGDDTSRFVLGADIDASATATWNSDGSGGYYGWTPLGNTGNLFEGGFDGLGHVVDALTINRPTQDYVGFFKAVDNGFSDLSIKNLGLTNIDVTGRSYTGGLIARNLTNIDSSYVKGVVTGSSEAVGGFVGQNENGNITNSFSEVTVTGTRRVGGFVGTNRDYISNSYSISTVTGTEFNNSYGGTGGFVGENQYGLIEKSYAEATVNGEDRVGGFVGLNHEADIQESYAIATVTGRWHVGGFAGTSYTGNTYDQSIIENSYAEATVTGERDVGGFIGRSYWSQIKYTYAEGTVTGNTGVAVNYDYTGGFVGELYGGDIYYSHASTTVGGTSARLNAFMGTGMDSRVHFSYYDNEVNTDNTMPGSNSTIGSVNYGKSKAQIKAYIDSRWNIENTSKGGETLPILTWQYPSTITYTKKWGEPNPTPPAPPAPTPTPPTASPTPTPPTATPTPIPNIGDVITSIPRVFNLSQKATTPQNFTNTNFVVNGAPTENTPIVSLPMQGQETKKVSHTEVKGMQDSDPTIVPVGQGALLRLVGSGVALPLDVEQEFYLVRDFRK